MTEPERIEANMSSVAPAKTPPPPPPRDWTAAFLGYLVPGLGHIYQGRVGKGALFMICLYVLFFYGMYLGQGKNVYLPTKDSAGNELPDVPIQLGKFSIGPIPGTRGLMHRVQFLGQFWMGIVSWPAIIQYNSAEEPPVLNVLVMYDALAGPAFIPKPQTSTETGAKNAAATPAAAGR
jgi:hypothetical protein